MARVELDGLIEVLHRLQDAGRREGCEVERALEVRIVCSRVDGPRIAQQRRFPERQLQRDRPCDLPSDLPLEREHVAEVALIALSPQVVVAAGIDELERDPHAVTRAEHAALDDPLYVQLFRDLRQRLAPVLVLHDRGA